MKSTPLEDCIDKTLRGSVFHNSDQYLLLVWSDGCVTELYSEGDEDDSIINVASKYPDIRFDYYDPDKLLEAGLDPDFVEGLKKAKQAQQDESADRAKEERRIAYERLKKEFEN